MRSLLRDEHCMSLFASGDRTVSLLAQVAVERSLERYPDGLTYALPPALAARPGTGMSTRSGA